MEQIYIQTMVSGFVFSHIENDNVWKKISKVPVFTWHFHEMFLPLVGKKSVEKQGYDSFKALKCEYFGILFCIVYVQAIPT